MDNLDLSSRPRYYIIFIHNDIEQILYLLQVEIIRVCRDIGISEHLIEFFHNQTPDFTVDNFCLAFYLGDINTNTSSQCRELVQHLINEKVLIVPIIKGNDNFRDIILDILQPINAFRWNDEQSVVKLANLSLKELSLSEESKKVFISYRRLDGSALAEQLYEALIKNSFEVFLDIYSIDPGEYVQDTLWYRLDDIAFLILLESPKAFESNWVFQEINFALEHNIGILVLTWPDTNVKITNTVGLNRIFLTKENLIGSENEQTLNETNLRVIISKIEIAHARALLNRRITLVRAVEEYFAQKYTIRKLDSWTLIIKRKHPYKSVLIKITPRRPSVLDYYSIDKLTWKKLNIGKSKRYLIHMITKFSEKDKLFNKWLYNNFRISEKLFYTIFEDALL